MTKNMHALIFLTFLLGIIFIFSYTNRAFWKAVNGLILVSHKEVIEMHEWVVSLKLFFASANRLRNGFFLG